MKKILLIVCGALVLTAGFFIYRYFAPREKVNPLTIIPESAALIIETSDLYQVWDDIKTKKVWTNIKGIPSIAALADKVASLDSLLVQENKRDFFTDKKVAASFHIHPGNNSDYIFYIPVNSAKEENFLKEAVESMKKKSAHSLSERKFEGHTIHTLSSGDRRSGFSYFTYKNLLIGSFSSVLLEDLIRTMEKKNNYLFWKKEEGVQKHSQGVTTLYINYEQLPSLFSLFTEVPVFKPISSFADESLLELTINDKELLLNGITYPSSKSVSFIQSFRDQKPQQFYLKNYIPNSTAALYYYGFEDGPKLRKSLEEYWKTADPEHVKEVAAVSQKYAINFNSLYEDFGNEIGLCISRIDTSESDRIVLIHAKDPEKLFLQLSKIVTLVSDQEKGKSSIEKWQGLRIIQMNIEEFPAKMLGTIFTGFPECYFTTIDNYVVLANRKQLIKDLVKDIEGENVWGKTLTINSSLNETITTFNVGLFVNVQQTWETILNHSTPAMKEEWKKNRKLLGGFDFLALQFSYLNESALTNMVLTHNLSEPIAAEEEEEEVEAREFALSSKVISPLYLTDIRGAGKELLVQDSNYTIHQTDKNLEERWKYTLSGNLALGVFTADIDKDRKWEYVFAAGNKIYVVDGKGNSLRRFPIKLADTVQLRSLSIMDYDNTKEYRIVVSDRNGHIYFYDSKGNNLDGWKPRKLNGALVDRVRHFRIGNKDLIVAVQENGTINVMNRKGEMYPGFPLKLSVSKLEAYALKPGKDFESTNMVVQNEQGELIKFNLKGKVMGTQFKGAQICRDSKSTSFILAIPEGSSLKLQNVNSNKSVTLPFEIGKVSIKYSNLSTKGDFYSIREKDSGRLWIYNEKGESVLKEPVSSNEVSSLFYNENKKQFCFYNWNGNTIELISF